MSEYIIIVIAAIIVVPLTFLLIARKIVQRSALLIILSGLFITLLGIFIGKTYPFYYTVLIMFALAFVFSVLVDKRQSSKKVAGKATLENKKDKLREESELEKFVKMEEAVASLEEDDFVPRNPVDEDLKLWMSDEIKDDSFPEVEEVKHGK